MKSVSNIIATYYRKKQILPNNTIDRMEYTMRAIENEITKVLMYIIIFSIFGVLQNFLLAYTVFVSIRLFAGGIHCKTYWGCATLSFFMLGSCVWIGTLNFDFKNVVFFFAILSIILPFLLSPVTPSFRIIKTEKHKIVLRIIAVLISLTWAFIARSIINDPSLSTTCLFTISLANYQLIVPKVFEFINQGGVKK